MDEIDMIAPDGHNIKVDREVSRIVSAFWSAGFKTEASCEGHEDQILPEDRLPWVTFTPSTFKKLPVLPPPLTLIPGGRQLS